MTDSQATLLLCEVGGLAVGVDCRDVHAVVESAGSELDRVFAGELFGRAVGRSSSARTLVMRRAQGARVVVDRVLGMRSISRSDLRPIPASVRALGAADWVLGLAELDQRFVWLLDLAWAVPEHTQGRPR
jgi:hypothetical protein